MTLKHWNFQKSSTCPSNRFRVSGGKIVNNPADNAALALDNHVGIILVDKNKQPQLAQTG